MKLWERTAQKQWIARETYSANPRTLYLHELTDSVLDLEGTYRMVALDRLKLEREGVVHRRNCSYYTEAGRLAFTEEDAT
jgi:hypothetical protein